jgi:hypothetical protein
MRSETVTDLIARQEWAEPIETGLQKAVAGAFAAGGAAGQQTAYAEPRPLTRGIRLSSLPPPSSEERAGDGLRRAPLQRLFRRLR